LQFKQCFIASFELIPVVSASDASEDDLLHKFINATDLATQVAFMKLVIFMFIVYTWSCVDF